MSSEQSFEVAVIGAGASGTLLAAQYIRHAPAGVRLALIDASGRPARGVAYETPFAANLLNVPAGNMSAFPDDREHFVDWLTTRLPGSTAGTFAPRLIYGEYLEGILAETLHGDTVSLFGATAVDLSRGSDTWTVHLDNGSLITARSVVLAIGNALAPDAPLDTSDIATRYRGNPWSPDAILGLTRTAPVLLIGTGLTTVDAALSLRESGHEGPIHAVSRHGRLYHQHKFYTPQPLSELPDQFRTPRGALRWTTSATKRLQATGGDWRAVIDSLRPHTALIWKNWSLKQRGSFLRHARNLWDIHRHRMAPEIAAQLTELLENGILTIHAGRPLSAEQYGTQARVTIRSTRTGNTFALDVDRVINCTGPSRNYTKTVIPLIARMREKGWLVPDRLRLGVETSTDGHLIGADGGCVPKLYTIGPLRIAALFESIAIPEIRVQADELANKLSEHCHD
ncbi:MAG: FAD/NAD(P)-binding protein [Desulfuromonadales bacterium]